MSRLLGRGEPDVEPPPSFHSTHLALLRRQLAHWPQQRVRRACTRSVFYEPDADELDELNAMVERDASKDEIILWLHKRADEIMWNDELP